MTLIPETQMKSQKNAFEAALADLGLRYWEYDIQTKRLYRSPLVQDEVGYSVYKDNVPESYVEEGIIHPDYAQAYLDFYHNIQKGNADRLVFRSLYADGSWGWLDISYKVLFDETGKPVTAIGVGGDVTRQKFAEEQYLKEKAEKHNLELLMKSVVRKDFDYLSFIYGKTQHFITYSTKFQNNVFVGDHYARRLQEDAAAADIADKKELTGALTWDSILSGMEQEGTYTIYSTEFENGQRRRKQYAFFYIDQEQQYICGSVKDITNIYEAEKRSLDSIRKANAAKTDFLSRMSHDIRTPMNAIIGLTALTLDEPGLSDAVTSNLNKLRLSSEFLLGLVNDILDMSKIEEGAVALHYEPYRYTDFLLNLETMFAPLCEQNGLHFLFRKMSADLTVLTDKVRLNQIFFNILSNAIKYTPEGGTVTYSTENLSIHQNRVSCDYVISDTGIGMSQEFQSHMFEPFLQENTQITSHLQGSGLGLSIAKNLTELMGGTMRIRSQKGQGTTVTIHLTFDLAPEQSLAQSCDAAGHSCTAAELSQASSESFAVTPSSAEPDGSGQAAGSTAGAKQDDSGRAAGSTAGAKQDDSGRAALRAAGAEKNTSRIAGIDTSPLRGKRILLAEDHPLNAEIATKILGKAGIQVYLAQNGKIAVEKFQHAPVGIFDAILMDIRMPVMNGLEATQAIRALDRADARSIPILAMTANAYEEDKQQSLAAGMNGHLAKPVDPPTLYRALMEVL